MLPFTRLWNTVNATVMPNLFQICETQHCKPGEKRRFSGDVTLIPSVTVLTTSQALDSRSSGEKSQRRPVQNASVLNYIFVQLKLGGSQTAPEP